MNSFSAFFESISIFFSTDPSLLLIQALMVVATCIIVFLVLFATRDILLRTSSLPYQIFCIVLVAALPVVGFLLYLLVRPVRTTAERRVEQKLDKLLGLGHKKVKHEASSKK